MIATIYSGALEGVHGVLVEVEVDLANGLPAFSTVGLPEVSVRESKDRVKAAIQNSTYTFPNKKLTVNLAPADLKKTGTGFDLPIALGVLQASGLFPALEKKYLIVGELSLDGTVKPIAGILPLVLLAREQGFSGVLLPEGNSQEGALVEGIDVFAMHNLGEAVDFLSGQTRILPTKSTWQQNTASDTYPDFSEVKGQEQIKRALEIAAAGGHNVLLEGPPGAGKTMLARRMPGILPPLTFEEAIEVTKVHSVAGGVKNDKTTFTWQRPFRSPHHTVSDAGLIGGGQVPRPGEVSLAHLGVLFLDELPEFRRNVLEGLRQPLEDGVVTIARSATTLSFPAKFLLMAAMNPCPCGFLNDTFHECHCTPHQIQRYHHKISGPLLDRFDMYLSVRAVPVGDLAEMKKGESSRVIQERVVAAREFQVRRFAECPEVYCNAHMGSRLITEHCELKKDSQRLLENAVRTLGLSARAYHRVQRVARTIADLDQSTAIQASHIAEAIQFRRKLS